MPSLEAMKLKERIKINNQKIDIVIFSLIK